MNTFLAIDVGGSSIKYAFLDENKNILFKSDKHSDHSSYENFVTILKQIYEESIGDVKGIGVSYAGTVDSKSGLIIKGSTFPFLSGKNVNELFQSFSNKPVVIENDSNSAARAELTSGCLKDINEAVVIVLGSSIGGSIIHDGRLYQGSHYTAGELCLIKSDIEDTGLKRNWHHFNCAKALSNTVAKYLETEEYYDGYRVFQMAEEGNKKVLDALDEFARHIAVQIYNLQAILDPQRIAIGGGISSQPLLLKYIQKNIDLIFEAEDGMNLAISKPDIQVCRYHNDSNLLGAYYHIKKALKFEN